MSTSRLLPLINGICMQAHCDVMLVMWNIGEVLIILTTWIFLYLRPTFFVYHHPWLFLTCWIILSQRLSKIVNNNLPYLWSIINYVFEQPTKNNSSPMTGFWILFPSIYNVGVLPEAICNQGNCQPKSHIWKPDKYLNIIITTLIKFAVRIANSSFAVHKLPIGKK